jgi:hypothetical protein
VVATTCDLCETKSEDRYPRGWSSLTMPANEGIEHRDICPRCTLVLRVVLGEMRKQAAPIAAAPAPAVALARGGR